MIDKIRKGHMLIAEFLDTWRLIPRAIMAGYAYMVYYVVVVWYTNLAPYMIEGCVSSTVADCIAQAPTSQHSALVVAVIGIAAPMVGFYVNTGKKWDTGFLPWNKKVEEKPKDDEAAD